ncbi:competence protein CoiA [Rubrobacter marinus]|uniref:competence protein CoiA n=1 Tax=Rubrobacter marinus TaxID=2653852 RepID=UPI0014095196|nr:competence protein CoiA family protein [Rubrobacter marinus]
MRCAVCGTRLVKKFGLINAWHFAAVPGQAPCDHESETVEHREAKLALFEALRRVLHEGWSVLLEERLPDANRRPDVLAVHASGLRVAFEVQYADLPEEEWRARREDYEAAGVRDYWLLGHLRQEKERDALADLLATEEGQRVAYVGRWEDATPDEAGVRVEEPLFLDPDGPGLLPPGAAARGRHHDPVRWAGYSLDAFSLSEEGVLTTPANALRERLERKRLEEERRRARREEAARKAREIDAESRERRRKWAAEKKAEERRAWLSSPERARALSLLGKRRLAALEEEGGLDRNIYAPPGRWKTELFLACVHGRKSGTVFDWFGAAGGVLRRYRHSNLESWAWKALWAFLDGLEREGLVEFHEPDVRGKRRYWRTTSEETLARRRRDLAQRQQEEERRLERARQEADEMSVLEAKWEKNRLRRLERERWEAERLRAWSLPEDDPYREAGMDRAERALSWLSSSERGEILKLLGEGKMVLLEREHPDDRAILTHPGEWKSVVFLLFVRGKAGQTFAGSDVASEVGEHYPEAPEGSTAPATSDRAVRSFLLALCRAGLLRDVGSGRYEVTS